MVEYQLRIELTGARPPVWRELKVPGFLTLLELHKVLQVAMGWWNSHLWHFEFNGESFSQPDPEFHGLDAGITNLLKLDLKSGDEIVYLYDFGDEWEHLITVEAEVPVTGPDGIPWCLAGAGVCPPEDAGGTRGFAEMLDAWRDPGHPRHQEAMDWMPSDFDERRFDPDSVNRFLALCIGWGAL